MRLTNDTWTSLNRTFYGIETLAQLEGGLSLLVLIVPFMELKQDKVGLDILALGGLNRTFYGIETIAPDRY